MIDLLKINIKVFERLNRFSQRTAIPDHEINEFKNNLGDFEKKWNKFESFLDNLKKIKPDDIEMIHKLISEAWAFWSDAERIISEFDELIRKFSKNYSPPNQDAALKYTVWEAGIPIELAKLEMAMKPLEYLKIKEDVYPYQTFYVFLKLTNDLFLVNDEYHGIIVLNINLTIKNRLVFDEEIILNSVDNFKKFNSSDEILFFCDEGEYLLYINLKSSTYKKIVSDHDYLEIYPTKIYYWKDQNFILCGRENLYHLDIETFTMRIISSEEVKKRFPDFVDYYTDSLNYTIVRAYPEHYGFIYKDIEKKEVGIRYKNRIVKKMKFYNQEVYDIKYYNDYIMFIEDSKLDIRKNKKRAEIFQPVDHHFGGGADFFEINSELYVIALAHNNNLGRSTSILLYRISDTFDIFRKEHSRRQQREENM